MVPEIKTIPKVDALVAVGLVVRGKGGENAQLDARRIAVLLDRSDDLDSAAGLPLLVKCFDDLTKSALTEKFDNGV